MKFNKKSVIRLNNLLRDVQKNREDVIDIVISLCPIGEEDCDHQLEENRDAIECEYFPLCNVLGSYALLTDKEKKKVDKVLDMFYDRVDEKKNKLYSMFA
jgi:hypothetical protein